MTKKNIQWLYEELPKLVAKGVISTKDAEGMRRHYGSAAGGAGRNLALIICSALGAFLIGLGIILLLGHNWENLSRFVRTVLSLMPLIVGQLLAGWTIWPEKKSEAWREGAAIFLTMMIGASIALVSQTYHIPGDMAGFMLSWALLSIPIVYLIGATLPAVFYIIAITVWACHGGPNAILFWPLAALAIPRFLKVDYREGHALRSALFGWSISICLLFVAGATLGKFWKDFWVIVYASLYTVLYLAGSFWFNGDRKIWQRPFYVVGAVGAFGLSFLLSFKWYWKEILRSGYYSAAGANGLAVVGDYIVTALLVITALYLFASCERRGKKEKMFFGAMPILAFVAYAFSGYGGGPLFATLLFNVYILTLGISRISIGIRNDRLGIVNAGMLMLTALIVARFFDSNMGFITRGIAFIVIGIGFLTTNIMLMRRKGGAQ